MSNVVNDIIIQCDCPGEMLVINAEHQTYDNNDRYSLDFTLAIYTHGAYREKPNLWWRIKYAWNHLRTGKIYTDYMVLSENKAEILAKFLKENIEKNRPTSI